MPGRAPRRTRGVGSQVPRIDPWGTGRNVQAEGHGIARELPPEEGATGSRSPGRSKLVAWVGVAGCFYCPVSSWTLDAG